MSYRTVAYEDLVALAAGALREAGVPSESATRVATLLAMSDGEGAESHGVARIPALVRRIRAGVVDPRAEPQLVRDRGAVAVLDGRHGIGQLVADRAMALAGEKARAFGIGYVAVRDATHFGRASHFARDAAATGLVGVVLSNASPRLVPGPGAIPVLGNNPWAVAWPSDDGVLCVDMANSVVAAGKIRQAKAAGEPIPPGWAISVEGETTTDPDTALEGALVAMGGHKGWALSLVVDVLCGGLANGAMGDEVRSTDDVGEPQRVAQAFAAMEIGHFGPGDEFARRMATFADHLRERSGPHGRLPGDRSRKLLRERMVRGVPVPESALAAIEAVRAGP